MHHRPASWVSLLSFALVVGFVPAYEASHGVWPFRESAWKGKRALVEGKVAREVDAALERDSKVRALIGPAYRESQFVLFRRTPKEVVPGGDDWLFLGQTVHDYPPENGVLHLGETAAAIADVMALMRAHGVCPVLLLVPNKESMVPAAVAAEKRGFEPRYREVLEALRAAGEGVADLVPVLERDGEPLYSRTDTHWTDDGALAAATLAARIVRESCPGALESLPEVPLAIERRPPEPFEGDLLRMLGFRAGGALHEKLLETRPVIEVLETGGAAYAGRADAALHLSGTSFSRAGELAAKLAGVTRRHVRDEGIIGRGPLAGLLPMLQEALAGTRPFPKVVVWELPERQVYLDELALRESARMLRRIEAFQPASTEPLSPASFALDKLTMRPLGGRPGWAECVASAWHPSARIELAEPVPGDGSVALVARIESPMLDRAQAVADTGAGLAWKQASDGFVVGQHVPTLVVLPLVAPDGAPVRAIRFAPLARPGTFYVGGLELWRKRP